MPFAVAVLNHPLGTLASLAAAIVAALYAAQSRRLLPAFAALGFTALTALAFLIAPPSAAGLAWLCFGVALLHAEFLLPTFGIAGLLGVAGTAWASWLLLAPIASIPRGAAAAVAAALLLAAVARTMRLRTLPP
jgi:membrane-bound ClpP family serine protease